MTIRQRNEAGKVAIDFKAENWRAAKPLLEADLEP